MLGVGPVSYTHLDVYKRQISYLTTLFAYLKLSEEDLPREIREGMERFWFDENGEITEKELSQLRDYGNEIQLSLIHILLQRRKLFKRA